MIEKSSGQVSFAVLSFGGFFGLGDQHYPLPWNSLKYDTELGGYGTDIRARNRGRLGLVSPKQRGRRLTIPMAAALLRNG
jgi:hypothetical protein